MAKKTDRLSQTFQRLSEDITRWAGSTGAFITAVGVVLLWAVLGPVFDFSSQWQLVINTGTTIATFLMVFLIQRSQNKDSLAVHLKLNELVAAMQGASNRLIDVEALSESDLKTLHRFYGELAALSRTEVNVSQTHSVEEARNRHGLKAEGRRKR